MDYSESEINLAPTAPEKVAETKQFAIVWLPCLENGEWVDQRGTWIGSHN